jgi:hypothetical protein
MKQVIRILLLLSCVQPMRAQFFDSNAIYFTGDVVLGNYIGVDFQMNYIHKEKYTFKIGYSGNIRKPKTQPSDFSTGLGGIYLLGTANPYDQFESYQVTVGRLYKFNEKGTIRLNLSVGLGYTNIREPENWLFGGEPSIGNYSWNYYEYSTVSLIISPKIEFPFTRFYGLTISPILQINKDRTFFGIGVGQMIGVLRKRNR